MDDPKRILLVEDNKADARLTQEALREIRANVVMDIVYNGLEALRYLRGEAEYAGKPRPDIVLLDLNLPMMDGRELLANMMIEPDLGRIPIVVLTSSQSSGDVARAYELGANCYVRKPADYNEFVVLIRQLVKFWLETVRLPTD